MALFVFPCSLTADESVSFHSDVSGGGGKTWVKSNRNEIKKLNCDIPNDSVHLILSTLYFVSITECNCRPSCTKSRHIWCPSYGQVNRNVAAILCLVLFPQWSRLSRIYLNVHNSKCLKLSFAALTVENSTSTNTKPTSLTALVISAQVMEGASKKYAVILWFLTRFSIVVHQNKGNWMYLSMNRYITLN